MSFEQQFQFIKTILEKSAEQRSATELRTVLTPLMANIDFFKALKLKPQEMNEVCGGLEYAKRPKDSYVIRFGE